jgi:hypothetical protein
MSIPDYFSAIAWIAEHDGKNGMGALQAPAVSCRPTVALVADMFGRRREAVASDVVTLRIGVPEPEPEKLTSNTNDSTTVAVSDDKVWLNGRELVLPPKATYGLE